MGKYETPRAGAGERLAAAAHRIEPNTFSNLQNLKEKCIPSIVKSGYSGLDADALLTACIRYGWAQSIEDKIIGQNDFIQIRPLEMTDFNTNNALTFDYNDKVIIIYGLEDATVEKKPYPIKQVSFQRSFVKVIDVVDVEDLYHTNYISFLTPILYRKGDKCAVVFDYSKSSCPPTLKINGLVFYK